MWLWNQDRLYVMKEFHVTMLIIMLIGNNNIGWINYNNLLVHVQY